MTHHDKARELVEHGLAVLGPHDDMPECVQRNLMVYVNMWQFRETLNAIIAQAEENRRLREKIEALPRSTYSCGTQWVRLEQVLAALSSTGEKG
ncbi:hypothetical protein [Paracoccus sp. SSJ]|uniref:hypothetical protein n=1 Tax=Paracoccus sp. SSJ TaxID=3050636 RepID=UPI002551A031|nr:hypothetical protein [Paracoccus sp. SSJ]MDK8874358.1 hypothetical protein [Paracoccus sp. SSJ]